MNQKFIPYEPPTNDLETDSGHARKGLFIFPSFLLVFGLVVSRFDFKAIARGLGGIILSPDILINDYTGIAGMGPAMINAALCVAVAFLLLIFTRVTISGPAIAAMFTIGGFALFGKNILNIWPGFLGAWLYSRANHRPFGENIIVALFGTALAPLSSEVAFGLGLHQPWNFLLALLVGATTGFFILPVAKHALDFHRGYNLYNIGFTAGLVGTVVMSALKAFNIPLAGEFRWAAFGPKAALPYLAFLFVSMMVVGMRLDRHWLSAYRRLLGSSGRLVSDFVRFYGLGVTLVNMGVMGLLSSTIVLLMGGSWNGPIIGGIFTIVGFAAFGKHPRNTLPPMLGAAVMALLSNYGIDTPASQLAILFVTTLAPISGEYGPVAGFMAGVFHLVLVQVVGSLHGGLNLYNNGFAGGLTAGLFLPVLDWLRDWRRHER
ncbi:MAG: DUF1576 domain-containing protein [Spirochaetia bacterium]|jgi:hypothetical protein|nr:DUF1576 domain-containing protein [Spirochaetia bacterium]